MHPILWKLAVFLTINSVVVLCQCPSQQTWPSFTSWQSTLPFPCSLIWFFFCRMPAGLLWQDSTWHVRRRTHPPVWKMWLDLGSEVDDGPHDRSKPRICICHIHQQGCCPASGSRGNVAITKFHLLVFGPNYYLLLSL